MKSIFGTLAITMALASCSQDESIVFSGVDPDLTVAPTQVMVLGTAHLGNYKEELTLEDLDPLMDRLEIYGPDVITIEETSGMICNRVRNYPREHGGYADSYCFDGAPYREESGLSASEGSYQAGKALLDWPKAPTAAQRRSLAAAFIASEELYSALVQWHRLDTSERIVGDGLGPKSVEMLNRQSLDVNESNSIAARLAARVGLERLFYADDHGSFIDSEDGGEAYGARVEELWSKGGDMCQAHFDDPRADVTGGDIVGAYRRMNTVEYQRQQMACDWKLTMNDAEPEQFGRRYTMGWQARNMRMASLIMTAAITEPGGRVLSIVGASHKPYFEAYLDQAHDIEIVDAGTVLYE